MEEREERRKMKRGKMLRERGRRNFSLSCAEEMHEGGDGMEERCASPLLVMMKMARGDKRKRERTPLSLLLFFFI